MSGLHKQFLRLISLHLKYCLKKVGVPVWMILIFFSMPTFCKERREEHTPEGRLGYSGVLGLGVRRAESLRHLFLL